MVYSSYHSRIDLVLTDVVLPGMNGVEWMAVSEPTERPSQRTDHGQGHLARLPRSHSFIQVLLGHADLRDTMIWLHLSTRQLRAAPNPLDRLELDSLRGQEPSAS